MSTVASSQAPEKMNPSDASTTRAGSSGGKVLDAKRLQAPSIIGGFSGPATRRDSLNKSNSQLPRKGARPPRDDGSEYHAFKRPRPVILSLPLIGTAEVHLPPLHTIARREQEAAGADFSPRVEIVERMRLLEKLRRVAQARKHRVEVPQ